ncbi:hypothetical protein F511_11586 [Dorcoceras hygrometricum]|uniref:RNA polymerase Rpb4/RPC9 core domain-containing protein n=1 Tax=Dorcoceras hygrometricum TaxID=472368 RepID=A0A2Z7B005_9LAMI|nr:hypothetical protein F511_11586 [Dorcoceras hygrometricum]
MAEKGGGGFLPGGKSALKSSAGKDDNSARSKKGKKVQFDAEGGWGKGGKGDKVANGSKKSTGKATPPGDRKLEQELPQNTTCMMDCEAAEILQGIQDNMITLSQDPDIKIPVSLKKFGVSDAEICLIANIHPESVDEVFALIPALTAKMDKLRDPLRIALGELAKLKEALSELANIKVSR